MPHDDPIKPARGCLLGLVLGIVLWVLMYVFYRLVV